MIPFDLDAMPHRSPMLMVERLLESHTHLETSGGITEIYIRPENIFLHRDGRLAREALVEILAQAFMAVKVHQATLNGSAPPGGYLAELRSICIYGDARVGETLTAKVETTMQIAQIAVVRGEIFRNGILLTEGDLRLYTIPRTPQSP